MKAKKMICLLLSILSMVCLLSACGEKNADTAEQSVMELDGELAMTVAQLKYRSAIDEDSPFVDVEDFEWTKTLYKQVDDTTFDVKLYGNISGYTDMSHMHFRKVGFCVNATVYGPTAELDAFYDGLTFSNFSIEWYS